MSWPTTLLIVSKLQSSYPLLYPSFNPPHCYLFSCTKKLNTFGKHCKNIWNGWWIQLQYLFSVLVESSTVHANHFFKKQIFAPFLLSPSDNFRNLCGSSTNKSCGSNFQTIALRSLAPSDSTHRAVASISCLDRLLSNAHLSLST